MKLLLIHTGIEDEYIVYRLCHYRRFSVTDGWCDIDP